jgi:Flp pilus assembly protein TadD
MPNNSRLYNRLAMGYSGIGEYEKAIVAIKAAITLERNNKGLRIDYETIKSKNK